MLLSTFASCDHGFQKSFGQFRKYSTIIYGSAIYLMTKFMLQSRLDKLNNLLLHVLVRNR